MIEYNILKRLEDSSKNNSKLDKFKRIIFAPLYFGLEWYCRNKIWTKFIYHTILTNDEIVDTLDKQDFCLIDKTFVKKELLRDPEKDDNPYDFKDLKLVRNMIKEDYTKFFISLLRKNIQFDVEDYINLLVIVDVETVKDHGEVYHDTTYSVILRWWREVDYISSKRICITYLSLLTIILSTILIILL